MAAAARLVRFLLRWTARLVLAVVLLVALLLGGVVGVLRSGLASEHLDEWITAVAKKKGKFFVRAYDVSGRLPFHLKVRKVEVGDASDVYITIENAEATWHPFDLWHPFDDVKWKIVVDDIHAERLVWTKLPHDDLPDDGEPFRWDRFPRILVGHLLVDDFDVSGTLLGGARARMRGEGSGVLGEWDHGHLRLDLERIDGVRGKARIDLTTGGSPIELAGSVTSDEDEGSAVGALARLTDPGAVRLDVRASGPMRDWRAEAEVTATGIGRLVASVEMAYTAEGPFELSGTFDPAARQREKYYVGPGAPMTVAAKGAWSPGVELRLDRVLLAADGRELRADGRLDLATRAFRVRGNLEPGAGGPERVALPPLTVASAGIASEGFLKDTGTLDATLEVHEPELAGVALERLSARLTGSDPAGESTQGFVLAARGEGLRAADEEAGAGLLAPLALLGPSVTLDAEGVLDLADGLLDAKRARLAGSSLEVEGPLAFSEEWTAMKASLRARSASLESLTPLAGTGVRGSAALTLDLEAKERFAALDARLRGDATDVEIGERGWNAVFGPSANLEATWSGAARGPAKGDARLRAGGIDATATVSVGADGEDLDASLSAVLDNMERLAKPAQAAISGRLEAKATAKGSLDEMDVEATVGAHRFAWNGRRFDTLGANLSAKGLPEAWSGEASVKATYGRLEAAVSGRVSMPTADRVEVSGLRLSGPSTSGEADLDLDLAGALARGRVKLRSGDLALWRTFLGVGVSGSLDLDVALDHGVAAAQEVRGRASVRDGAFAIDGNELVVDALDLDASDLELAASPRGSAHLEAKRLRYGGVTVVRGVLDAAGVAGGWRTTASLDVDHGEKVSLDLDASVAPSLPLTVSFARLDADLGGVPVSLAEPAKVQASPEGWSVVAPSVTVGERGRLGASVSSSPTAVRLDATLESLPLDVIPALSPGLDLVGTVDGRVLLAGPAFAEASGDVSLRGSDVASAALVAGGVSPVDLRADARLARGRFTGSAALVGLSDTDLRVEADLPLSADSREPMVVDLVWKGEVAEVLALFPLGEDDLRGRVDADLRLTGTMASPRLAGVAVVDGGAYESATTGLVLTDIALEVAGSGDTLTLRRLEAKDGHKGTVSATGGLRFGTLPAFEAGLDLVARDAVLARLDLVTARADAELSLKASRKEDEDIVGGSVTGSVRVADVRVQIPDRFVANIPELKVVEVGADGTASSSSSAGPAVLVLDLDVAVRGDNRIFVTGRGLESEWRSDLAVRGTTADPRIVGTVSSVRGQLGLLGRRFDLRSATLRFDGTAGNQPYLAMTAEAEANDITAIVDVKGPALRPAIELRSDPSLPRDEVLSRVLFGQSATSLTPLQSVALARSVAELAGAPLFGGGPGILGGIGRTFGLDRLGIESSGSDGAAALTASKYLTDDVYLRVQQGLTPESSKLSIEWEVFRHITVESDVSQDAQGEVGVNWRWDY